MSKSRQYTTTRTSPSPTKTQSQPNLGRMRTDISKVKVYVRVKPYLETNKDIDDLAIDILSDKKIVINLLEKYYIHIYIYLYICRV